MTELPTYVGEAIQRVATLLVEGKYAELQQLSRSRRLPADEMREAVLDYGRELVAAPGGFAQRADAVPVENATPRRWSVNVPLWTKEEGRSDLTLSITVVEADAPPGYAVEIDDLHVL